MATTSASLALATRCVLLTSDKGGGERRHRQRAVAVAPCKQPFIDHTLPSLAPFFRDLQDYLTVTESAYSMFQLMFAIITPALISGAVGEWGDSRFAVSCRSSRHALPSSHPVQLAKLSFGGGCCLSRCGTSSVTHRSPIGFLGEHPSSNLAGCSPPLHRPAKSNHACFACCLLYIFSYNGFFFQFGAIDYAGGMVVHTASGVSAFVLAYWLGRPKTPRHTNPHNVPYVLLGAALLWFGWFGFNAGSALAAGTSAGRVFTNTQLAPAMAMITWAALEVIFNGDKWFTGRSSAVGAASAAIIGLVG